MCIRTFAENNRLPLKRNVNDDLKRAERGTENFSRAFLLEVRIARTGRFRSVTRVTTRIAKGRTKEPVHATAK